MSSWAGLCYIGPVNRLVKRSTDRSGWERLREVGAGGQRILVVGSSSPWLEGVVDLLQLAGYDVAVCSDWEKAEQDIQDAPPDLAILDLTDYVDSLELPQQVTAMSPARSLPILLLNSTGDDRIWHLERVGDPSRGRVDLYAHSLFGPDALLDKVRGCLAS
jgi:DNA-binding response OmpR family regulator